MSGLVRIGRVLFAVAMASFGAQCLAFASGAGRQVPGPPWTQTNAGVAWVVGVGFIVLAGCLIVRWQVRMAALLLGVGMLLRVVFILGPGLVAHLHSPNGWTVTFEVLAMCGGAAAIAGSYGAKRFGAMHAPRDGWDIGVEVGRYLFVISLVVFGVQHFLYAKFIAALIPGWIPWHLFWAEFVGVAFFATAVSFATGKMVRVVGTLLGVMFLLWVMVLHGPRIATMPHDANEWTSGFVALAIGGAALILTAVLTRERDLFG